MRLPFLSAAAFLAMTSASVFAAPTIGGDLKVLSTSTNKEINSVRVGKAVKLKLTVTDFNLLANKDATVTYALSVVPKGSNTPVSFSGKLSALITLPAADGGAKKTAKSMASLEGSKSFTENLTIPDIMPAGKATLTITVTGAKVGSVNLTKVLNITL